MPAPVAQRSLPWQRGPAPGPNPGGRGMPRVPPSVPIPSDRWRQQQQLGKGLGVPPPQPSAAQTAAPQQQQQQLSQQQQQQQKSAASSSGSDGATRGAAPSAALEAAAAAAGVRPPGPPDTAGPASTSAPSPSPSASAPSPMPAKSRSPFQLALEQRLRQQRQPAAASAPPSAAPGQPPAAASAKGFGAIPKPSSKREWRQAIDWLVMEKDELLPDRSFFDIADDLNLPEEARPQVSLLVRVGFTKKDLEKLSEARYEIFLLGATNIKMKLKFMREELGMTDPEVKATVLKFPRILEYRPSHTIQSRLSFLEEAGLKASDLKRIVMRAPMLLELSIEGTLAPRIEYLRRELGTSKENLGKLINRNPQVLTYTEASMQSRLDYLKGLGMTKDAINSAVIKHPQVLHYRASAMQRRVAYMEGLGLTKEEVALIVSRFVQIFSLDVESNLTPKVRYLTEAMGQEVKVLCSSPALLSLSLHGRIIPRHRFYEERRKNAPELPPLPLSLLQWTDDKFAAKLGVTPQKYKDYAARMQAHLDAQSPKKVVAAGGGGGVIKA